LKHFKHRFEHLIRQKCCIKVRLCIQIRYLWFKNKI